MRFKLLSNPEIRAFGIWAIVGVANTLVHLVVVMSLVEGLNVDPVMANGWAFVCANLFSYWANSRFTFRGTLSSKGYLRFFSVSLVGLGIALGSSSLAASRQWHYLIGVAITMLVLPMFTYLTHRLWTWGYVPK